MCHLIIRILLYKLNDDGKIFEKPKYIIKKELVSTAGDDMIGGNKVSVITELCLMRDDSVYTVSANNKIYT